MTRSLATLRDGFLRSAARWPDHPALQLGATTPVLATTATANARVTADVARQLGEDTVTLRGTLARPSFAKALDADKALFPGK